MSSAGGSGVRAKFVDQPTDLADLRKLLEDARGRLVSARRGVGDEVLLRIRPLRGGGGGDWGVGTQASDWVLASPSSVLAGARASSAVLDGALSELEQIEVSRLEVTDSLALVVYSLMAAGWKSKAMSMTPRSARTIRRTGKS